MINGVSSTTDTIIRDHSCMVMGNYTDKQMTTFKLSIQIFNSRILCKFPVQS